MSSEVEKTEVRLAELSSRLNCLVEANQRLEHLVINTELGREAVRKALGEVATEYSALRQEYEEIFAAVTIAKEVAKEVALVNSIWPGKDNQESA